MGGTGAFIAGRGDGKIWVLSISPTSSNEFSCSFFFFRKNGEWRRERRKKEKKKICSLLFRGQERVEREKKRD